MFNIKKFNSRLKSSASQYSHNEKGTASIEFVLVAPLLIALYVGLYEVSIAYTVNGTVNRASEVAASFPTFEDSLNEVTLANIITASAAVMDYPNFDIENFVQIPGLRALCLNNGATWERPMTKTGGVIESNLSRQEPAWRAILDDDGRVMVMINWNVDLGDAWEHADMEEYASEYTSTAYRLGVNYMIYSMTH